MSYLVVASGLVVVAAVMLLRHIRLYNYHFTAVSHSSSLSTLLLIICSSVADITVTILAVRVIIKRCCVQ